MTRKSFYRQRLQPSPQEKADHDALEAMKRRVVFRRSPMNRAISGAMLAWRSERRG